MQSWFAGQFTFVERKRKLGILPNPTEVDAMLRKIKSRKQIPVKESNDIGNLIEASCLQGDDKAKLQAALIESTQRAAAPKQAAAPLSLQDLTEVPLPGEQKPAGDDKSGKQTHDYFENYLTQEEWTILGEKAGAKKLRPEELAGIIYRAAARIGFCNIDEQDYGKLIGTFGLLGAAAPTHGPIGLKTVQAVKKHFSSLRKNFPGVEAPKVYPQKPELLPEPWLTMSKSSGPLIECPFDTSLVALHRMKTPTRSSHWSVKSAQPRGGAVLALTDAAKVPVLSLEDNMQGLGSAALRAFPGFIKTLFEQQSQHAAGCSHGPSTVQVEEIPESPEKSNSAVLSTVSGLQGHQVLSQAAAAKEQQLTPVAAGSAKGQELTPVAAASAKGQELTPAAVTFAKGQELVPVREAAASESTATLASAAFVGLTGMPKMSIADVLGQTKGMLCQKSGNAAAAASEDDEDEDDPENLPSSKGTTAAKAKTKAKAKSTAVAALAPKDDKLLRYAGTKASKPIHYGCCTVYVDTKHKMWRLKPAPGSRKLQHFPWKTENPKTVWSRVAKELTRLNR